MGWKDEYDEELASFKKEIIQLQAEIQKIQQEGQVKDKQIMQLNQDLEASNNRFKGLYNEIQALKAKYDDVVRLIHTDDDKYLVFKQEYEEVHCMVMHMQAEDWKHNHPYENAPDDLDFDFRAQEKRISDLKQQFKASEQQMNNETFKLSTLETEQKKVLSDTARFAERIGEYQAELSQLQTAGLSNDTEFKELRAEYALIKAEKDAQSEKVQGLEKQIGTYAENESNSRRQLQQIAEEIEILKHRLEHINDRDVQEIGITANDQYEMISPDELGKLKPNQVECLYGNKI